MSSRPWSGRASFVGPPLLGPRPCIWCQRKTVCGGCAEISGGSTWSRRPTSTLYRNILDFSDRLAGCKVFSKIELRKGYWQIPVRTGRRQRSSPHLASDPWTARQCCHLAYVAKFTADIQHVGGHDNVAADALHHPYAFPVHRGGD